MAQQAKVDSEMIEDRTVVEQMPLPTSKSGAPLMRSKADDLGVWQSVKRYKRVGLIAMIAAFCASLDGYRKELALSRERPLHSRDARADW